MSWTSRTVVPGTTSICYVQDAGVTAAPGTADELGFITSFDFEFAADVTEKGPYINSSTIKKSIASYSASGTLSVNVGGGVDAVRERFFTAAANKTRLKITVQMAPTTGVKEVFDQAIVGISGTIDPAEGMDYEFTFDADTYTHTAAS
jgi:hypothetical protein